MFISNQILLKFEWMETQSYIAYLFHSNQCKKTVTDMKFLWTAICSGYESEVLTTLLKASNNNINQIKHISC